MNAKFVMRILWWEVRLVAEHGNKDMTSHIDTYTAAYQRKSWKFLAVYSSKSKTQLIERLKLAKHKDHP